MIDITSINKKKVTDKVREFMTQYGGNHVALYRGWSKVPEMAEPYAIEMQLAFLLQTGGSLALTKRLIGKLRKVNKDAEDKVLGDLLGVAPPDMGCLG